METLTPINYRIASGIERTDIDSVRLVNSVCGEEVGMPPPTLGDIAEAFRIYSLNRYRKQDRVFVVFMAIAGSADEDEGVHVCGGWVVGRRVDRPVVHLVDSWPPAGSSPVYGQVVVRRDYAYSITDFASLPDKATNVF